MTDPERDFEGGPPAADWLTIAPEDSHPESFEPVPAWLAEAIPEPEAS